jgi:hypothetical protein
LDIRWLQAAVLEQEVVVHDFLPPSGHLNFQQEIAAGNVVRQRKPLFRSAALRLG